jgi:hypothetical protein
MSKSVLALILALPGIILAWWVAGLIEDVQQQVAVSTVSAFSPSFGLLLQLIFIIGGIAGLVVFALSILAKFGIKPDF